MLVDLRAVRTKLKSGKSTILQGGQTAYPVVAVQQPTPKLRTRLGVLLGFTAAFVFGSLATRWFSEAPPSAPFRHFVIATEANGAAVNREERVAAAISPDGSKIVYLSDEQPPRLWLHPLDDTADSGLSERVDRMGGHCHVHCYHRRGF